MANNHIPDSFRRRKDEILRSLTTAPSEYQDKSPKGSIDTAIRPLIDDVNAQAGLVTTSSCAGRISVFREGRKKPDDTPAAFSGTNYDEPVGRQLATPGGKGGGGTWLFVSHDPLSSSLTDEGSIMKRFGLSEASAGLTGPTSAATTRYVHFKFEPMILHILTASAQHAQMVLTAAAHAGFRESGAINLMPTPAWAKLPATAMPMVGVRCLSLGLDSIIGFQPDGEGIQSPRALVTEEYLHTLVQIAAKRFEENAKKTENFRAKLLDICQRDVPGGEGRLPWQSTSPRSSTREDAVLRRERKKQEGLERREADPKLKPTQQAEKDEDSELLLLDTMIWNEPCDDYHSLHSSLAICPL
ncbi:MAG: hypothetical protein M1826_003188 [Phylliscum demangeonii]|nr:MAG: hypothetical protein M1826_003188 [Phylliscum demangeonii]